MKQPLYPVDVKYSRVEKLDELIEFVLEQLFLVLEEQDKTEREKRLDTTCEHVVEYSEHHVHGEAARILSRHLEHWTYGTYR